MSYSTSPRRTGLPRSVLRWLQSLDLTFSPRHFCRDFSNGFLIAEIFSWYYPEDIQMRSFENGTSLAVKLSNWSQLGKFFAKRNLKPIRELIDGTIHCKPGAAEIFVQDIYTMLTNRRIKHIQDEETDFTDSIYQDKLPMVARSTASRAIKSNIKLTEIMVEPNIYKNRQKINAIINMHMQRRLLEREQNPERFNIKRTLGECAVRRPSLLTPAMSSPNVLKQKSVGIASVASTEIRGKMGVHFKTIQVKQAERFPFDVCSAFIDRFTCAQRTTTSASFINAFDLVPPPLMVDVCLCGDVAHSHQDTLPSQGFSEIPPGHTNCSEFQNVDIQLGFLG